MNTVNIHYDSSQLRQDFLQRLNEISQNLQTGELIEILSENWVKQRHQQVQQIQSRLDKDFSLVVVGDFKHGKSTLINALLGTELVTTDVTPETITINEIQYGTKFKCEACLCDGGLIELHLEDLKAERLIPLLKSFSQPLSHLRIEAPIDQIKGLRLVDTPGTGDIFNRFDQQVHDYLMHADAVVYVLSALSPLSMSERAFLRASVLPRDFPKIFFVVNMMDLIPKEKDAERLLQFIKTRLSGLFPGSGIFGLSASDELRRQVGLPNATNESNLDLHLKFQELRDSLRESIELNRDVLQLDRSMAQSEQLLKEIESQVRLVKEGLEADQEYREQAIAYYQNQSSKLASNVQIHKQVLRENINKLSEQACAWLDEFMRRIEAIAIAELPLFNLEQVRRHYHFFLTDTISSALNQCLHGHYPTMEQIAREAAISLGEEMQCWIKAGANSTSVAAATFGESRWTNVDTLHLIMEQSPLDLFTALLFLPIQNAHDADQMLLYQQRLQTTLPELKHSLLEHCRHSYEHVADQLAKQLEKAFQKQMDDAQSAWQRAQALSIEGGMKLETTQQKLQRTLAYIEDSQLQLGELKRKLWDAWKFSD